VGNNGGSDYERVVVLVERFKVFMGVFGYFWVGGWVGQITKRVKGKKGVSDDFVIAGGSDGIDAGGMSEHGEAVL
jgi:hypothetical protein